MDNVILPTQKKSKHIFLKVLLDYVPLFSLIFSIGVGGIYLLTRDWQHLAVSGILVVWIVAWLIAGYLFRRNHPDIVITGLTLLLFLLFPSFLLFWSGTAIAPLFFIAAWVFPIGFIHNVSSTRFLRNVVIAGCILSSGAVLLIDRLLEFSRVDITDLAILRWIVPLSTITLGSFLLLLITRTSLTKNLYLRTIFSFIIVVIIPIITISTITTVVSIDTDRQYAIQSLQSVADQKSSEITLWSSDIQVDVFSIPHDADVEKKIHNVLSNGSNIEQREELRKSFDQILLRSGRLEELFLMDEDGFVLVSTLPDRYEQQYLDQPYFLEGESGLWMSEPIYQEDIGEMSIFVSRPILSDRGQVIGVLSGRANLRAISRTVLSRAGLGSTGKALLVSNNRELLNGIVLGLPTIMVDTQAVEIALAHHGSGSLEYIDADGVPVVGVFSWIPGLNVIVITEMNQGEAFSNAQSVLQTNIIIAIFGIGLAIIGAIVTTRAISAPVNQLVETANRVAAGDFTARVELEQEDELGTLGSTLNNMTTQIHDLVANLELRISDRTRDLERRTTEIRTAAQVARDASISQNITELLSRSTRLVRERFGFYHTGIFLIDQHGEYAVLSAAGGEAGQLMLANQHKLLVGEVGIVGFVAKTGQARVALDTGDDAVYFRNPLLPYTHSEMALPLKIGESILGVLDVQSDKADAFDQEDIDTLQVMADQIAVAIQRTRLLEQYDRAIEKLESSSQDYSRSVWKDFSRRIQDKPGYKYQGTKIEPIYSTPTTSDDTKSINDSADRINGSPANQLSVPIKLRGLPIGTLHFRFRGEGIPSQTIAVIEEAASRLAISLENARLVQDAQSLAQRERQVNLITSQVQKSGDFETILQNAIRELGNTLGVPSTFIQIGIPGSNESSNVD